MAHSVAVPRESRTLYWVGQTTVFACGAILGAFASTFLNSSLRVVSALCFVAAIAFTVGILYIQEEVRRANRIVPGIERASAQILSTVTDSVAELNTRLADLGRRLSSRPSS